MTNKSECRPLEIFGFPTWNISSDLEKSRKDYRCPFLGDKCNKLSRLIDYPFGVCSVKHHDKKCIICPQRFKEAGNLEGIPKVLEDVALHYFGDFNNTIAFSEVKLPSIGNIDYVLVRHKPMRPEVDDFISVEIQADSTTSTGGLVEGLNDYFDGININQKSYQFGINTYDSIKRSIMQLINKGIVYELWGTKCYWVMQEYIFENLCRRYSFSSEDINPQHSSIFALYDIVDNKNIFQLTSTRFLSTSVDDIYRAMRNNPSIPNKDKFIDKLNAKLKLTLLV